MINTKLQAQRERLQDFFLEREEIIEAMFIAMLCKQHVVMIGPPGTAKSYLIESFCQGFEGFKMFSWQLTKFSTPEELFGPYSLQGLKKGKYERVTNGKLPESELVYVDEVFNANSSILNALNSSMNERIFQGSPIPLQSLYGATNFIPTEKVLVAFFDRFLFRFIVPELQEARAFEKVLRAGEFKINGNVVTKEELEELQSHLHTIDVSGVIPTLVKLRDLLRIESVLPSTRRFRWALDALRARALLEGRQEVVADDLFLLRHILWEDEKHRGLVERVLMRAVNPIVAKIRSLYDQAEDVQKQLRTLDPDSSSDDLNQIREGAMKLKLISEELDQLKAEHMETKTRAICEAFQKKIMEIHKRVIKEKLGITI